ncbi:hypothetical protein BD324DRAFT_654448 [Kockovaella imperatae]|uniref:Cytoplasmic protein n=1 Tax=Kockovaella imperatae TaxID=4999 RepID=A0A1Y1URK8_9TREE|nr:hypothetical protein BD324DRAFT_654448 [Kockovaella imperatae]ORX40680.1 hypothetical protein BD324DRAFT_654448 [Kockovaella imperatae]
MSFASQAYQNGTNPSARYSRGTWQPLPYIHSGFVVHPYQPSFAPPTPTKLGETSQAAAYRNKYSHALNLESIGEEPPNGNQSGRYRFAGTTTTTTTNQHGNPYEVSLDIGDEFFAFEEYRCLVEEDGRGELWYRGYIVQSVSLANLMPLITTTNPAGTAIPPRPEPSVLIGIFPASCVYVRHDASMDDGSLTAAYEAAVKKAQELDRDRGNGRPTGFALGTGFSGDMDTVKEEDEEGSPGDGEVQRTPEIGIVPLEIAEKPAEGPDAAIQQDISATTNDGRRKSLTLIGGTPGTTPTRAPRPKSLILEKRKTIDGLQEKDQPPLPRLTAGDSTLAGQLYPLVDEIACAIRDWYQRLPTYLVNRDYRLFTTVVQHIDALWLGRRQLLSQTLSGDELARVRRECVSRLVKCNVAQGLEVIVRSLEDGSVTVTEKDRAFSGATWAGGINLYIQQLQLAYIDLIPLDTLFGRSSRLFEGLPLASDARSQRFSLAAAKARPLALGQALDAPLGVYHHVLLDVRAFIANPCAPGETAELFFSLFNAKENRFITEEFCLILNHLGSPARDSTQRLGRLRTLFTDLKPEDIGPSVYLICRLVRNGALKMRSDAQAGTLESQYRNVNAAASRQSQTLLSDRNTMRGIPSISETVTDDSFSITSGFAGHRTTTTHTNGTTTTPSPSMSDGRPSFRRPLGCAVLEMPPISKLLSEDDGKAGIVPGTGSEYTMSIHLPRDEATFATLHEDLIRQRSKEFSKSGRAEAIVVSLKVLRGSAPRLAREHPSLLQEVPFSSRLSFPDVVLPNTDRNDLYVKLWSASFFPSPTSSGGSIRVRRPSPAVNHGNVQVSLEVRKSDGTALPDIMFSGGSGEGPVRQYHSLVFQQNDTPTFGELVKIALPGRSAPDCHLFLTFRSRTATQRQGRDDSQELEKPFAFAYLPLLSNTSCVQDGSHDLILYRLEKNLQPAPNVYLGSPFSDASTHGVVTSKTLTPLRDRMMLRTYLCSSTQTQDPTLQALFHWQKLADNINELCKTLDMFSFVNEEEISKFVPSILDSLFGMTSFNAGEKQEQLDTLIFRALVKVLSMTSDRRFRDFDAVLDDYISNHFTSSSSSFNLLRSMKSVMSRPESKDYRSFLKVWHLFFRFIIRSRELDRGKGIGLDATSAHIEADFQRQMKAILEDINSLMKMTDKGLIGTQTLAVQHYADVLPYLAQVFQPLETAEMVITFADTLTYSKGSIAIYKLLLLLQVIKNIFDSSDARALLVPALVRWVKPHLGRFEEIAFIKHPDGQVDSTTDTKKIKWMECNRLAVTVAAWTVTKLQDWLDSPLIAEDNGLKVQEEDNIEYCLTLLPSLLESYAELDSPGTLVTLQKSQVSSSIYERTPDMFPSSHPFPLLSELPPPPLVDQIHTSVADEVLPSSGPFIPSLGECSAVIFTLILASPTTNMARFLAELLDIEGAAGTAKILRSVFAFCRSILRSRAFPRQWLSMNLMFYSTMLGLLQAISDLLEDGFVPPISEMASFDQLLWTDCLELLCDFCGSEELALEDHAPQRRRAEWIIAGDLRDDGARLLMKLWNALGWPADSASAQRVQSRYGGYQTRFTSLAGRVLGLCLSSHDQLCETAVEILFSMIYAEYVLDGKFESIATDIFVKLDVLVSGYSCGRGFAHLDISPQFLDKGNSTLASDPTMRAYFVAHLRSVFEASPEIDADFHVKVGNLLDEIELFIELLLDLRDIPDTTEWKDERSLAIYRLILFTQRVNREDLYTRFVHQLVRLNVDAQDWMGAGKALCLHADLHGWTLDKVLLEPFTSGSMSLPAQNAFARKESLYYHAIDYFAEAEAYEAALHLCQELVSQHQRLTFNVPKLSELLSHQARLWERINAASRKQPEYFRVAYFGDFSLINRNKDFIVRGRPWQRFSDFCDEIQHKHPAAIIHRSKVPPPESDRDGEDQVIWITSVHPEPDPDHPALAEGVPESIQSYHKNNEIKTFSCLRPYSRAESVGEGVMTWIEKTWLTTEKILPDVLNRSEVVEIRYEQISPLSTALAEVGKATGALRDLSREAPGYRVDVKLLGTVINGAVDSPVNGGVKLYRKTFIEGDYLNRHPLETAQVGMLDAALRNYVQAIQNALSVHRVHCKDVTFHEALKSHFYAAFPDEIAALPPWSDSTHSAGNMGRAVPNGHGHGSKPSVSTIRSQGNHIAVNPARMSTMSLATETGYLLPELRVGPSIKHSGSAPSVAVDASHLRSESQHTISPINGDVSRGVPSIHGTGTSTSSPRQSVISAGKRASMSSGLSPNLGNRAKSFVGSLNNKSRVSLSVQSEVGDADIIERDEGVDGMVIDIQPNHSQTEKMGRFGSFMRRKE